MSAFLDARGLSLQGRLESSDLAVEAGTLVSVVGPNGSGKTSLLHALAGIGTPGGSLRIEGAEPWTAAPALRRKLLAYLPAGRDIPWPLRARDLVGLGAGARAEEVERTLETLELMPFAERRVDRLSTGERSRVLIARALAGRPKLLLLDEPVANLDPLWQLRVMERLREESHEAGRAAIVAIHDLDLAARYSDRMIMMSEGRIVADGEPSALIAGQEVGRVFGIERGPEGWRPLSPPERPRSLR